MTGIRLAGFRAALALGLGLAGSSSAAPITWEFEGTVRFANLGSASALGGSLGVSVGASAFGRMVYESTTPASSPGSTFYLGALTGFEVEVGSYSTASIDPARGRDFYQFGVSGPVTPYGWEFAQASTLGDELFHRSVELTLSLIPNVAGVIRFSTLPVAPPALSVLRPFSIDDWLDFGFGTGVMLSRGSVDTQLLLVQFTRLEAVPEPAGLTLLASVTLSIVALRRR